MVGRHWQAKSGCLRDPGGVSGKNYGVGARFSTANRALPVLSWGRRDARHIATAWPVSL